MNFRSMKKLFDKYTHFLSKESHRGTYLAAQWLRIRLPMQGTQVRSLVLEDPTCCRATKRMCHNYWAHMPQLLKPARLEPCSATGEATAVRSPHTTTKSSPRSPQLETAHTQQQRPNTAKNKFVKKKKNPTDWLKFYSCSITGSATQKCNWPR